MAAFTNGLPTEHHLFVKLIVEEEMTLSASYALVDKHAFWDEVRRCIFKDLKKYIRLIRMFDII